MEVIAKSNCGGKNCPTIYRKDAETIIVQGYNAADLFGEPLPDGEQAVAIPVSLLAGLKL